MIWLRIKRVEKRGTWGWVIRATEDRGSALALTLAFLAFFSLVLGAILSFADTGFRTTMAIRDQREVSYAVDAVVEGAIESIRQDAGFGRELIQPGAKPCPTFTYEPTATVNGTSGLTVTCQAIVGSGGFAGTNNIPNKAILALSEDLALDGPAILDDGTNDLKIGGDVVANTLIKVRNPTEQMTVTGVVLSPACEGPGTLTTALPTETFCNFDGKPGIDPNYPPVSSTVGPDITLPSVCPAGTFVFAFSPGRYTDAGRLSDLMKGSGPVSCPSGTLFWFKPGIYYFDFPAANSEWKINDGNANILAGTPTDTVIPPLIDPPLQVPTTVPFPDGCKSGEDPLVDQGVQFIFGGSSHIDIGDSTFEICPYITTDPSAQLISIYGVTSTLPSPSNLNGQDGCILLRVASPTQACPLINAVSPNGLMLVHGTVYAPRSWLNIRLTSPGIREIFERGVIIRVIHIDINPSSGFGESPVSVPRSSPPSPSLFSPRKVLFIARLGTTEKLRARVDYVDDPAQPECAAARRVCPKSWNIVR